MTVVFHDASQTAGFVYVLINEFMPGIVKIGSTERNIKERINELSSTTGVPMPFTLKHYLMCENPVEIECLIHENFSQYRVNDKREFFKIPYESVISYMNTIKMDYILADIRTWSEFQVWEFTQGMSEINPDHKYLKSIKDKISAEFNASIDKLSDEALIAGIEGIFRKRPGVWRAIKGG